MKLYYVYKITNQLNNKIYIGKSKEGNGRWQEHLRVALGDRSKYKNKFYYLHDSIRLHGKDNFTFEILSHYDSEAEAYLAEEKYIELYQSNNREYGMNLHKGGTGGNSGMKASAATKLKMSQAKKGTKQSKEWIEKRTKPSPNRRSVRRAFTDEEVQVLRRRWQESKLLKTGLSLADLVQETGMTRVALNRILTGKRYGHVPFLPVEMQIPDGKSVCTICKSIIEDIEFQNSKGIVKSSCNSCRKLYELERAERAREARPLMMTVSLPEEHKLCPRCKRIFFTLKMMA
jgi:group I intron endonuclease